MTNVDRSDEPVAFYTAAETAAILRVDRSTIYRQMHAGEFPCVKVGTRRVVPIAAIQRMHDAALTSGTCVDAADFGPCNDDRAA